MELLYADDLVLIAETKELLLEKVRNWKEGMEKKGLRVNAGKTKFMWCRVCTDQTEDSGEHPCGVWCSFTPILHQLHQFYTNFGVGRELDATQSFVWSVIDGFTRGVVVFQEG